MVAVVQAFSPTPLRVYFVGNSLTFRNDLPGMVVELGASLDPRMQVEAGMTARDGMSLERHWREGEVLRRLREEDWDVLVLQEQSSRLLADPAQSELYLRLFAEAARAAGTEVILLQTWVRADMPEAYRRQRESYRQVANAVNVRLAPVGEAWHRAAPSFPVSRFTMPMACTRAGREPTSPRPCWWGCSQGGRPSRRVRWSRATRVGGGASGAGLAHAPCTLTVSPSRSRERERAERLGCVAALRD